MPHDTRDTIVDFVRAWSDKTDIPACRFFPWLDIGASAGRNDYNGFVRLMRAYPLGTPRLIAVAFRSPRADDVMIALSWKW